jgi:hypothetical protein
MIEVCGSGVFVIGDPLIKLGHAGLAQLGMGPSPP